MEYSTLKVASFFRRGSQFIPIAEFEGGFLDTNYIEGALSVSLNGNELFDTSLWDYIDQLWAYLADGICAVARGESYSCYFPDQPIKVEFEILGGNQIKIFVGAGAGRTGVVSRELFISEFSKAAQQFFLRMNELVPEDGDIFTEYIKRLSKIIVVK
jgi:hypothetical protein